MLTGIRKLFQGNLLDVPLPLEDLVQEREHLQHETILEEAQRLITGDRNQTYDHPIENFNRIARIWSVIFGIEVTEEQVGLAMVGVKIAREAYMPKRDNLVDGAGYFGTIAMIQEERARREQDTRKES